MFEVKVEAVKQFFGIIGVTKIPYLSDYIVPTFVSLALDPEVGRSLWDVGFKLLFSWQDTVSISLVLLLYWRVFLEITNSPV